MLSPGFLQDLLARTDITEVVGRHVELKKAGINHKGLCPFHGEKSPSFIVSPSRQTYHCFGCGAHGDAIRFLTEHTGLGFMDAVRDLAQQAGLQVPDDRSTPEDRAKASAEKARSATLSEVLAKAGAHYRQALKANPRAVDYLKRRGLTGAVAAQFGLGYAPEGWRALASAFAHYDDPLLAEAGLVIVQDGADPADAASQKRYDRFRDRIMFPIRSVRGEVIGFGGRVLDQGEPKYLNSPETPVFHKGQELYGLFEARQALRQAGHALVVEGYMDVVALAQAGVANAVATLGTACTAEHVAKLFRFTESVVFSFDGDAAGRRAAGRALEAALPHATDTRSVRFLFLPPEHDPDSFVRDHGAAAFRQAVAAAVPLSEQLVLQAGADCDLATAEGRARMVAQAQPLVALLPEGLLREQIMAEVAQRGGLALDALQAHWARQAARQRPRLAAGAAATEGTGAGRSAAGSGGAQTHGSDQHYTDEPELLPWDSPEPTEPSATRWRKPWRDKQDGGWTGDAAGGGRSAWRGRGGQGRLQAMGPRRAPPQTATLLDRTAWLLARHSGLWLALDGEQHEFLSGQPEPYNQFFAGLERVLHEHGPVTMAALLPDLRQDDDDGSSLPELLARISAFHDFDDDERPQVQLAAALHGLRQRAVDDELAWLLESGELSDDATARRNQLFALRAALKTGQAKNPDN